jgi:hypothetical protein
MVLSSYGPDVINTSPHHQGSPAAGSRKIRSSPDSLVEGGGFELSVPRCARDAARAGITRALDADPANPLGDAFLEVPRGTESSQTHRWREQDSNRRFRGGSARRFVCPLSSLLASAPLQKPKERIVVGPAEALPTGRHHPGMAGDIILERRARSNRNAERDHHGFASDFPRNPQACPSGARCSAGSAGKRWRGTFRRRAMMRRS